MGVCITAEYKGAPTWHMSYGRFSCMRNAIAMEISPEFGNHYAGWIKLVDADKKTQDAYIKEEMDILNKYKPKHRFVDFLYMPDADGRLSPFKCKAVLDGIQNMDDSRRFGYMGWNTADIMTVGDFKHLLNECYQRRCYMVWY